MEFAYNMGIIRALEDIGMAKFSNETIAQNIAAGADPQELQSIADSKITEKDIEGAAKVVQVIAQMKQMADQQGYTSANMGYSGAPMPGASQVPPAPMNQGMQQGMPQQGMMQGMPQQGTMQGMPQQGTMQGMPQQGMMPGSY